MSSVRLAARVDELIIRAEDMKKTFKMTSNSELSLADREKLDQWKLSCLSIINVIVGKKNIFYESFPHKFMDHLYATFQEAMSHYLSVLRALKEELDGALFSRNRKFGFKGRVINSSRRSQDLTSRE